MDCLKKLLLKSQSETMLYFRSEENNTLIFDMIWCMHMKLRKERYNKEIRNEYWQSLTD